LKILTIFIFDYVPATTILLLIVIEAFLVGALDVACEVLVPEVIIQSEMKFGGSFESLIYSLNDSCRELGIAVSFMVSGAVLSFLPKKTAYLINFSAIPALIAGFVFLLHLWHPKIILVGTSTKDSAMSPIVRHVSNVSSVIIKSLSKSRLTDYDIQVKPVASPKPSKGGFKVLPGPEDA
jgi:hypothetical protein